MKKILVPTDFSEGAFKALKYAVGLAEKTGASIEVVNAYSMPPTGSTVMVDITEVLQKNSEEELAALRLKAKEAGLDQVANIRYESSHGGVVEVINRRISDQDIDVVVMGTQGASGLTEKWLGSNTSAAAKNIDKPLWAIPAEGSHQLPGKILIASDLKVMEDEAPIRFVAELADAFNAEVKFFHVRTNEEDQELDEETFKDQVLHVFIHRKPRFSFYRDDDIDEGIEEVVERENPDLLVVFHHEYGFFQNLFHSSVSRNIIHSAKLPVLVLRG